VAQSGYATILLMSTSEFRQLPSVDRLLSDERVKRFVTTFRRELVLSVLLLPVRQVPPLEK
jgi:hypothetical protein